MKFLMSVNHKFYGSDYNLDWVDYCVDGAEIYLPLNCNEEINFLFKLAEVFRDRELVLSLHTPPINLVEGLTAIYNRTAEIYEGQITLTAHPLQTKKETLECAEKVVAKLKGPQLLIENLDDIDGIVRPGLREVSSWLIEADEGVGMCLDIGHIINFHKEKLILNNFTINKIKNVHVHGVAFDKGEWVNHGPLVNYKQLSNHNRR